METKCRFMAAFCTKSVPPVPCPHATFDGKCDCASCGCETLPSFKQMAEIYLSVRTKVSKKTRDVIVPVMERIAATAGLTLDSKAMLSAEEWMSVYTKLKDGKHTIKKHDGAYDPATIKMWFSVFTRCAGMGDKNIRLEYVRRGMSRPNCDLMPDVKFDDKDTTIEELAPAQVDIVSDEMTRLRNSARPADRRRFVWMWFAFYFGVRPADICRLKWGCIKDDPCGGKRLEYVPHKTDGKTGGRAAAGRIHPKLMRWIEPFVGNEDEYVIERKTQHTGPKTGKHGAYEGQHGSIHAWVNRFMRKTVGVKGHMAGYLLRRDCSKWTLEHKGSLAETILLGHTEAVRDRNYVNRSSINVSSGALHPQG